MKKTSFYIIILVSILLSCTTNTHNPEFIKNATGRYLYNADELIEVYFKENQLYIKWRGATEIKPLKIDEDTYYIKEMNEKIQFKKHPKSQENYMVLVPKNPTDSLTFNFKKLQNHEKTPTEYLQNNQYNEALEAYMAIKKLDSLHPIIEEAYLNRKGYNYLKNNNHTQAVYIFKINTQLYPNSANVYDSYAEALYKSGDTLNALLNYKKSIALNNDNVHAKNQLKILQPNN